MGLSTEPLPEMLMRATVFAAATLLLSALAVTPSWAEDVTVASGRATVVASFTFYNGDTCGSIQYPRISISPEPKHGKVTSKRTRLKVTEEGSPCLGKTANSIQIVYQSDRGYRGADSFGVQAIQSDPAFVMGSMEQSFSVTVR
ncbi:MAG: hypothetical protein ACK5W0_07975 [Labrys sp. (in: a-proteobacteria)]